MKFCGNCGNQMNDDMLFCQKCGTKFAGAENDPLKSKVDELKASNLIVDTSVVKWDYILKTEGTGAAELIKTQYDLTNAVCAQIKEILAENKGDNAAANEREVYNYVLDSAIELVKNGWAILNDCSGAMEYRNNSMEYAMAGGHETYVEYCKVLDGLDGFWRQLGLSQLTAAVNTKGELDPDVINEDPEYQQKAIDLVFLLNGAWGALADRIVVFGAPTGDGLFDTMHVSSLVEPQDAVWSLFTKAIKGVNSYAVESLESTSWFKHLDDCEKEKTGYKEDFANRYEAFIASYCKEESEQYWGRHPEKLALKQEYDAQIEALAKEKAPLEAKREELHKERSAYACQEDSLGKRLEGNNKRIDELGRKIFGKKKAQEEIEEIKKENVKFQKEITEFSVKKREHDKTINELDEAIKPLNAQTEEWGEKIKQLRFSS